MGAHCASLSVAVRHVVIHATIGPVDIDGFMKAIERLNGYWFEVVILPKGD